MPRPDGAFQDYLASQLKELGDRVSEAHERDVNALRAENDWLRANQRSAVLDVSAGADLTDSYDEAEKLHGLRVPGPPIAPPEVRRGSKDSSEAVRNGVDHALWTIFEGESRGQSAAAEVPVRSAPSLPSSPPCRGEALQNGLSVKAHRSPTLEISSPDTSQRMQRGFGLAQFWLRRRDTNLLPTSAETGWRTSASGLPCVARAQLEVIVESAWFESFFAVLILLSTVTMAIEVQARGIDTGHTMMFAGSPAHPRAFSQVESFLEVLELAFGSLFVIEVLLKVLALGFNFARSGWNLFDMAIITVWLIDTSVRAALIINPMILRLCRLARLLRLIRLVKMVQMFDSLHLLIGAIRASTSVLLWSFVLLFMTIVVVALCFNQILQPYILNEGNPEDERLEIYHRFGTTSRSIMTMFEITLANWVPTCRLLIENVSEWFGVVILIYRLIVGFAVVKVITGVFLHETFKVASSNDDIMIIQRERVTQQHASKMNRLFHQADTNGDGVISKEEFMDLLTDRRVKQWLAAMELQIADGEVLFELLSNGDGEISPDELVDQVASLKGSARSIDLATLAQETHVLKRMIEDMHEKLSASIELLGSSDMDEDRARVPHTQPPAVDIRAPP